MFLQDRLVILILYSRHEFHVVSNSTRALTITRNRKTNLTLEESRVSRVPGAILFEDASS